MTTVIAGTKILVFYDTGEKAGGLDEKETTIAWLEAILCVNDRPILMNIPGRHRWG